VLGLRVPGVIIENVGTTAKTLPEFTDRWTRMLDGDGDGDGDDHGNNHGLGGE